MRTAILFAGQGSQKPGMGKSFYEAYPEFTAVIDRADELVDFDLKALMFAGSAEDLAKTEYTQPALAAFAAGVFEILKAKGVTPDYVAGLSLGEYSALYAAGVFDLDTLIRTTAYRGSVMAKAGHGLETKMCAVLGLTEEATEEIVAQAAIDTGEPVYISNYNAKGQNVISGLKHAVERAKVLAKEKGARRCMDLKVSSAFHTPFMEPASEALASYFPTITFGEMKTPVVFNAVGRTKDNGETLEELLVHQVKEPVRMTQTLHFLEEAGVTRYIEVGPGKALTGFVKHTVSGETFTLDEAEDLAVLGD